LLKPATSRYAPFESSCGSSSARVSISSGFSPFAVRDGLRATAASHSSSSATIASQT